MVRGANGARPGGAMLSEAAQRVAVSMVLMLPAAGPLPALQQPAQCKVIMSSGRCVITAADPGRPGGPAGPPAVQPGPPTSPHARMATSGPTTAVVREEADDVVEELQRVFGFSPQLAPAAASTAPRPTGRAAPVDDPGIPVRSAISQLQLAEPTIRLAGGAPAVVGVPVWLWLDDVPDSAPTATAAVGDAQVTATARLTSVEWTLGPSGATVSCAGPGTPWNGQVGASPDCGYVYRERSLPERTGGTGRWPITATAVWQVGWRGISGGAPVAGGQELRLTSETSIAVDEIQVLVVGGGE